MHTFLLPDRSVVGFSRRSCGLFLFSVPHVQQPFVDFSIFCYLESLRIYSFLLRFVNQLVSHFTVSNKKPGGILKTSLHISSAKCSSLSLTTPAFHQLQDGIADTLPPLRTPSSIPTDAFPTSSRAIIRGGLRAEAATNRLLTAIGAFSSCSSYSSPILQVGFVRSVQGPAPTAHGQPRTGGAVLVWGLGLHSLKGGNLLSATPNSKTSSVSMPVNLSTGVCTLSPARFYGPVLGH